MAQSVDFQNVSTDELWELREQVARLLVRNMEIEKRQLDDRLKKLRADIHSSSIEPRRTPYPKVRPKYQNPEDPSQTWAGRGKKPRWMSGLLAKGKSIQDFRIR